jgi:putative ABC transport system substrate-binding protein
MLTRRNAVALLAAGQLLGWPAAAQVRLRRIGFVSWFKGGDFADLARLRAGLTTLGLNEGRDFALDARFTDGDRALTERAVREFVEQNVDVLVVRATATAHIAKAATDKIPVVMLVSDPLATGLVTSLARPGGNLTGLSLLGPDLAGKRLEYLREADPTPKRVAFLGSKTDQNAQTFANETLVAGRSLGIDVIVALIDGPGAVGSGVFQRLAADGAQAVVVQPIFTGHHQKIVQLAMEQRLPVVSNYRVFTAAGGLLSFGPDDEAITERAHITSTSFSAGRSRAICQSSSRPYSSSF